MNNPERQSFAWMGAIKSVIMLLIFLHIFIIKAPYRRRNMNIRNARLEIKHKLIVGAVALFLGCLVFYFVSDKPVVSSNSAQLSSSVDRIPLDNLDPSAKVVIDSLIDTCHYIFLESSQESIIGNIDELIITNRYIVVLDRFQTQSIFIFNRSGKFLNRIHRIGKGPGQFTQPFDVEVDKLSEQILLLHGYPSKIIKYNLQGEFLGEIALPIRYTAFTTLTDKSIILYNEPSNRKYGNPAGHANELFSRLLVIHPNGDYEYKGGQLNRAFEENYTSKMHYGIMNNNGLVSFQPIYCDTIFQFSDGEAKPQFILDFGTFAIDQDKVKGMTVDEFSEVAKQSEYVMTYGRHSQTNQFITFGVYAVSRDRYYQVFYDKFKEDLLYFHQIETDNLLNLVYLYPTIAYQDYFVSIIDPYEVMKVKDNLDNYHGSAKVLDTVYAPPIDQLSQYQESSNPVLCFFKLRPEKINMQSVFYE